MAMTRCNPFTELQTLQDQISRVFDPGKFVRSFNLPRSVDSESIEASYDDGVLEIVIPKRDEAKPRQIRIGKTS